MRAITSEEISTVSGSGPILIYGAIGLYWTAAAIAGGPVGLGSAVASTIATQGLVKLDKLQAQHEKDKFANNQMQPYYNASILSYN
jgi:hypothetical protein